MKRVFFGGVHPADRKELSAGYSLIPAPPPARVVIPLRQHVGNPCQSLVKPGQQVKLGQKIGDGPGLCVPIHASVSGTVLAVEPRPHPGGQDVLAVVIENDFQDTPAPAAPADGPELTAEELFDAIREAGIVGMGGAAFPTDVKARSALGKVDTLIANACECEPYITADDVLLRTCPEEVLGGINLLHRTLGTKRAVLAVEDNKQTAIAALLEKLDGGLELQPLPTRYPQGAEKQLIQAVTGRQIPPGGLPADVGCVVFNVATLAAVYRAVVLGLPLTSRIVTVTGEGVGVPRNFLVRIGTPLSALLEAAGGLTQDVWKVLNGGPMMGIAQDNLEAPVVKGTNAVVCLSRGQGREKSTVCIRCGKCLTVCPVNLQPLYLYRFEKSGNLEALKRLNVTDCIECGCCAYICPGKLPLVEHLRRGKRGVREGASK